MARKKKETEPCEYCCGESWNSEDQANGHQLYWEIYPDANYIQITSYANDENGEIQELSIMFPMKYCPNCGRKLEW